MSAGYCGLPPEVFRQGMSNLITLTSTGPLRLAPGDAARVKWIFHAYLRTLASLVEGLDAGNLNYIGRSVHSLVSAMIGSSLTDEDYEIAAEDLIRIKGDILTRLQGQFLEQPPYWHLLIMADEKDPSLAIEMLEIVCVDPLSYNYTAAELAEVTLRIAGNCRQDKYIDGVIEYLVMSHIVSGQRTSKRLMQWLEECYEPRIETFSAVLDAGSRPLPVSVGLTLDEAQKLTLIGNGSFGSVYRARTQDARWIAIKKSSRDLPSLASEIAILSSLSHPHVIKLEGFSLTPTGATLILEDGGTSLEEISELKYDRRVMMEGCLKALDYLHATAFVIHNDIKPGNIVIDTYGQPRLIDFGLTLAGINPYNDIVVRNYRGTVMYAPLSILLDLEAGNSEVIYGRRLDIYALGVVFLSVVIGDYPFGDNGYDFENVITTIEEKLGHISRYNNIIPESTPLITAMLHHNETHRPTAAECLAML